MEPPSDPQPRKMRPGEPDCGHTYTVCPALTPRKFQVLLLGRATPVVPFGPSKSSPLPRATLPVLSALIRPLSEPLM